MLNENIAPDEAPDDGAPAATENQLDTENQFDTDTGSADINGAADTEIDPASDIDAASESTPAEGYVPQPELNEALAPPAAVAEPEAAPRKEVPGGRAYEIIYITRSGDPAAVETTGERVRALIEGSDGAVDHVRTSETRRLAYPIKKQTEGVYVVVNARFQKEINLELDRFMKLEESVLRHLILRDED